MSEKSEEGIEDENPDRRKEPTGAPPTRPGVLRLYRAGAPDMDKVSADWAGQVGLPEGEPDRCNTDRCPTDPVEGDIPR